MASPDKTPLLDELLNDLCWSEDEERRDRAWRLIQAALIARQEAFDPFIRQFEAYGDTVMADRLRALVLLSKRKWPSYTETVSKLRAAQKDGS